MSPSALRLAKMADAKKVSPASRIMGS